MDAVELTLWAGLVIGLAFGIAARATGFCLVSGLRGWWAPAGTGTAKIRAFALALALAIAGSQALDAAGLVDLRRSLYAQTSFAPALILTGGLLFGYGMVLANGCGARALVLLPGGNLRSFVVLVSLGIAAYATLSGLIAPLRIAASAVGVVASPPDLAAALAPYGFSEPAARLVLALPLATILAFLALRPAARGERGTLAGGAAVGLAVVAGWYATGVLGADDFQPAPLASLTFVAPVGETIQYAMLATGMRPSFGVAIVAGVFLGALATALVTRTLLLEGFASPQAMLRSMAGGALMGVGGALALGCSIGQGLTGLSTLAPASFVAAGGILGGAWVALRGPLRVARPAVAEQS
ncbi:MAG: YeeE/YedE family protein [Aquamicrobium sp.]|uniref:YeeE/YedE family protein n=1 Tax=Aquamicrobium sp. TaxID=1872579 RepID=UPI00349EF0E5|nr:YeeE/YedE family protein [Aquamicrobium sp.]